MLDSISKMLGNIDIPRFFNYSIDKFLQAQVKSDFCISTELREVITKEATYYNQIIDYPLESYCFPVIETACHLGLPNEPEDISCILSLNKTLGVNIFLHTANIRANGAGYSRGLIYRKQKFPFLKNDFEQNGVCFAPPLELKDIKRVISRIPNPVTEILFEPVNNLLSLPSYQDQLVVLNNRLYWRLFGVKIITLPLEKVSTTLLILDFKREEFFHRIIVDQEYRQLIYETFNGIQGCWSGNLKGSFIFTSKNEKNDLVNLNLIGDKLIGRDRPLEINLNLYEIQERLNLNQLVPSTFTSLSLLLFNSAQLFGGYFQIDYLAEIISRFKSLGFNLDYDQNCFSSGYVTDSLIFDKVIESKPEIDSIFSNTTLLEGLLNNFENLKKLIPNSVIVKEAQLYFKAPLSNITS